MAEKNSYDTSNNLKNLTDVVTSIFGDNELNATNLSSIINNITESNNSTVRNPTFSIFDSVMENLEIGADLHNNESYITNTTTSEITTASTDYIMYWIIAVIFVLVVLVLFMYFYVLHKIRYSQIENKRPMTSLETYDNVLCTTEEEHGTDIDSFFHKENDKCLFNEKPLPCKIRTVNETYCNMKVENVVLLTSSNVAATDITDDESEDNENEDGDEGNGDVQNGDVHNGPVQNGDVHNGPVQNEDVQNEDVQNEDVQNGDVQNGDVQNGDVQNGDVQNGDVQNGDVQNGDVQNGDVQNGDVQNG
ncbi:conserved protein, unknown function, partial [Hepatocystis sp. ex Piliocolobus tephrosceles]